ncbi:hypothetical protein C7T35_13620 [Variovorax sp. WS11]|uniref:hypothetical protein n=1 Tax=Variovorax sp. WS11 TaxID=1105204 RepID=UPI000D0DFD05|nr:hypothetical protein [Variovorax sp. WS11]NDZ16162.1 hypothetical protein [Variovorax sp. WS11]PSL83954.1 hypothetical protein C7T35_13620 [Variovorax sp. WS11]
MKKIVIACSLAVAGSAVFAKLPAPAATPEAKAKAAETAARTAWSGKVEAYQLCQAQDRVAARYRESAAAAGKQLPAAPTAAPCADPGPFAYTPPEQKPIEAAGAHSPPGTASSPPSTAQPAAAANPTPKQ